ncbi:MAG: helix-turn-helix transcriptional regulator [Chloroflexi bacterium]|nr:helix-turn-helix transcriptional regulator [Chloroflexota bacterium]
MPRPSKHISPDTLGGRIRAAREQLRLSLAAVADGHYSTSLISQIERNRVDPSQESLRFLAKRLQLPLADLETLAQQPRETEVEAHDFKSYEDLRIEAAQLLANKEIQHALSLLEGLHFPQIPPLQRWHLAALRGHCYFAQRRFLKAQQDFMYAVHEQPKLDSVPAEQKLELMLLHLHLAGAYRELQQLDDAYEQYRITLQLVNRETPFGYVAETHWGIALIAFAQANKMHNAPHHEAECKEQKLHTALEHAENARFLYRSIGELLRAASVTCQIAQIEQTLGNVEKAQGYLREILSSWSYILKEPEAETIVGKRWQQEKANVVSAAACSLANIELDARNYEAARMYVDCALEAGKRSYKLRRAEAYLTQGRLFESTDSKDPQIEEAFCNAIAELADTDRIAARIRAHACLGSHLRKIGRTEEGEQEFEKARLLSDLVSPYASTISAEDSSPV